jgi:hypothetical protein
MTTCAVIDLASGKVINLIVAEPTDPIDDGMILQASPPDGVEIGTPWDGTNFVLPVGKTAPIVGGSLKTL